MCGICGFYGKGDKELLEDMTSCLINRGPDSEGYYRKEKVGLGARRLAIVGIDSGQQPVSNEEGTIVAVFNGEIYNFQELRNNLESENHSFRSETDTEVIVHLYEEYGEGFVSKLNGMFSIAIWDKNREKLVLYRDRLGIKPLFYCKTGTGFYFGSEVEPLLHADIDVKPDIEALSYFWNLRYIPTPYTAFEGVRQLEPGHMMTVEGEEVNKTSYWRLDKNKSDTELTEKKCIEKVRELVKDSIKKRIPSEVSFGVLLSGGVDSSTTVALLDKFADEDVSTFSVIFDDEEHDERNYSRLVAEKFDTDHTEYHIDNETANKVGNILSKFSNPVADPAIIPTHLICSKASKENKVVFTGSGSDELFGGYNRYIRDFERYRICSLFPDFSKKLSKKLSEILPQGSKIQRYLEYLGNSRTQEELFYHVVSSRDSPFGTCSQLQTDIEDTFSYEEDYLSRMTRFDIKYWLPDMLLTKIDRCSMNNSIEARVPFLDHRIVELSREIPWQYKVKNQETKNIIKKAFSSHLPEEVINREVTGLSVPIEKWMKEEGNSISSRFEKSRFKKIGFLDEEEIMRRYKELKQGNSDHTQFLWKALVIQIWHENYVQSRDAGSNKTRSRSR